MDMPLTLSLLGAFAAATVFCGWRGARPPDFVKGPRLIPWRMLMMFSAAGVMLLLAHLSGLLKGAPGN
jgi:hypothetical protein